MGDALVLARADSFDVFNALDLMENRWGHFIGGPKDSFDVSSTLDLMENRWVAI
jgi:hypothetical protein